MTVPLPTAAPYWSRHLARRMRCGSAVVAALQGLESRRLLANDPLSIGTYTNGLEKWLNVAGTSAADEIVVTKTASTTYRITNGTWWATRTGTWAGVRITAGAENDAVTATGSLAFRAWVLGDAGNDTLTGGLGNDLLFGGEGADSIRGGSNNDQIRGEGGVDTLAGESGNDSIYGGADTDSLVGDAGSDSVLGDAGNDTLSGGEGNDTLLGGTEADSIAGGNGNDALRGEAGADTLLAEAGNDTAFGGLDADTINGGVGNDSIRGEAGNDTLNGEAGLDTIDGGANDDTISGGDDADSLLGGDQNDVLAGNAGGDTLNGGLGDDSVDGGADNDRVMGDVGTDDYTGGAGSDTLDYTGRTVAVTISLDGEANDGTTGENDRLATDLEIYYGGNASDTITGDAAANRLYGGLGNDTIDGGEGDDRIYGSAGADSLLGGDGDDSVYGQADADRLSGDAGDDFLEAGAGNDAVEGGIGRDKLIAVGGGVYDSLTGGDGLDSFWLDSDSTEKVLDASSDEAAARATHRVKSFVNYGATVISKEVSGQKFAEPAGTGRAISFAGNRLFAADGPSVDDIYQGQTGDCWYLATLAAVAQTQPEVIRQAITELGDGTFAVRLKSTGGTDQFIRVDGDLLTYSWSASTPVYAGLGQQGSIWVALMEKALTWVRGSQLGTYATISSGWMGEAYTRLGMGSDGRYRGQILDGSVVRAWLQQQLDVGKAVTVGFNSVQSGLNLVANHAYTVVSIDDRDDGGYDVVLRNPWGVDNNSSVDGANDGYVTLTFSQIFSNYTGLVAA